MVAILLTIVYFMVVVGLAVFSLVVLWRAMRAHESIAESMRIIAERMSAGSKT
ncbi:MAG: hypothetical protein P8Z79_14855 [Sedimentisphaerales bacterium]|jgi:hypothetical protein